MLKDLVDTTGFISVECGLPVTPPVAEKESAGYTAHLFNANGRNIIFRAGKITPTKTGQFVTLWKRQGNEPIQPFEASDEIDFFIIAVRKKDRFGIFVFPASVLLGKKILSGNAIEGKRAMRVYPPWDRVDNAQATQTKNWQMDYFIELKPGNKNDVLRAKRILTGTGGI